MRRVNRQQLFNDYKTTKTRIEGIKQISFTLSNRIIRITHLQAETVQICREEMSDPKPNGHRAQLEKS